jgi:hypothetical protein
VNTPKYSPGVMAVKEKHPSYSIHESTVKNGFPIVMLYLMHPGDSSVGIAPHLEDYILLTKEGQSCEGWLLLSDQEIGTLEDEIFANQAVSMLHCIRRFRVHAGGN